MRINKFLNFHRNEGSLPVMDVLQGIGNGSNAEVITNHRDALQRGDLSLAETIKKGLPAYTFSATYEGPRRKESMTCYNGIIVLDIDKLSPEQVSPTATKAREIPHTLFCFRSPGNRGLKIGVLPVVSHPLTAENHQQTFRQVQAYYEQKLGVKIDPSGKDVGRLCFVSHDPDIYINPAHQQFLAGEAPAGELPLMELKIEKGKLKTNGEDKQQPVSEARVRKLLKQARRKASGRGRYEEGNRNNYVYDFSNCCNRLGIPVEAVIAYASKSFAELNPVELQNTICSAYSHTELYDTDKKREVSDSTHVVARIEEYLRELYMFRYNLVIRRIELRKKKTKHTFKPLDDMTENSIWCDMVKNGIKCKCQELHAVLYSNFSRPYDPFVDYFGKLPKWDGTTDYIGRLADTVQTTHQELWHRCFRKWLVAMVACATLPDKENHTVLILKSEQGKGKTSWCSQLIPTELQGYCQSGALNPYSKDSIITLSECIFVNFDELGSLNTREMNKLKELITKGVVRERLPYGRNAETLIRRASCAGSVNDAQIFEDLTGSRRFLCFEALEIDYITPIDYINVYSQAVALLNSGFKYWLSGSEIQEINDNNEDFRIRTPEEELLFTYFRQPTPESEKIQYLTATEILRHLCLRSSLQITKKGAMTIGTTLKKHGFEHKISNKGRVYTVVVVPDETVEQERYKDPDQLQNERYNADMQSVIDFAS